MRLNLPICLAVLFVLLFEYDGAVADEVRASNDTSASGQWGLRAGFDSNPTDGLTPVGSAFVTETFRFNYEHRESENEAWGVGFSSANTMFDPRVNAPNTANLLTLRNVMDFGTATKLRTTFSIGEDQTWARRENTALLRNRLEYDASDYRLFANADLGLTSLNERNALISDSFLPAPENFATFGILPGAALKTSFGEIGASVSASHLAFLEEYDYLGLRRDQDRLQPNLFWTTTLKGIGFEGSVSPFMARFRGDDFDPVNALLYTGKLNIPIKAVMIELSSSRSIQDTTLPYSAIDIKLQHEARLTWKVTDKTAVSGFVRWRRDDYKGLDLHSVSEIAGADYAYRFDNGFVGILSGSVRRLVQDDTRFPMAYNVQIGVERSFDLMTAVKTGQASVK